MGGISEVFSFHFYIHIACICPRGGEMQTLSTWLLEQVCTTKNIIFGE